MQDKKLYLTLGLTILFIGLASFVAGRMFDSRVSPIVPGGAGLESREFTFSSTNNVTPAPELPTMRPEIVGLYVERIDNTITVQVVSLDADIRGTVGDSSVDLSNASTIEVIVTSKTTIYQDVTELNEFSASTQQLIEESTLDYLNPPTMISIWGDRSGDRIVARILLYSNSLANGKP